MMLPNSSLLGWYDGPLPHGLMPRPVPRGVLMIRVAGVTLYVEVTIAIGEARATESCSNTLAVSESLSPTPSLNHEFNPCAESMPAPFCPPQTERWRGRGRRRRRTIC